ncbi:MULTISPECIES: 4-hydroxy-tetrahydrodipicolinate reductase [Gammaproteobacteria]|uniref:4-hydroxy-tetrahydrodipicolinate reductase n=1 Tax=Gammaproteobacteria TaxID=1236 RepID=UPI000DD074C0|nr:MULTISPECIES: 4-hydroxy-tetrahydrodipicolinate reductase [Gammaproteobacteria]RTE87483.1 4-hydroxy-tetrahydrodipicolinate reductase [Aliidiomarina sp. B3213]TCZ92733.1 4-hydroxy-tetrahydrodipicolinate reductase [Lysobacter sp. N42]
MIKVGLVGATGRMGLQVAQALLGHKEAQLAAAITHSQSTSLGKEIGACLGVQAGHSEPAGLQITDQYSSLEGCDVVIDFAVAEGLSERLKTYQAMNKPVVLCTTGLSEQDTNAIHELSESLAVVYAANTSVGITLLRHLVEQSSAILGIDADIEIVEAHHTRKKDAPSGTALLLGQAAASGRGQDLAQVRAFDRNGEDMTHEKGSIGFASIRAGDIVGEHTVYLVTGSERLELTHRVASRATFAEGAIKAAQWLADKSAGNYTMEDVLGLDAKP